MKIKKPQTDKPEEGKIYALTGVTDSKCILNGYSWKESEVKEEEKEKILDFVKTWLNSNITDELQPEVLKADSRDLLEKIKEME